NLLEDFLDHYGGCLLIVSHDRWFMDKLVEHIFVFEGDGKVKDYYGNYTEYRLEKEQQLRIQKKMEKARKGQEEKSVKITTASNRLSYKEKKELETLEVEMAALEKEKIELVAKMNRGNGTSQELIDWGNRYKMVEEKLDEKSMRWLELSDKDVS
ncbi:MAG: ABC transporter ATP-binding protein, partial [Bacteroidales bacterium]